MAAAAATVVVMSRDVFALCNSPLLYRADRWNADETPLASTGGFVMHVADSDIGT